MLKVSDLWFCKTIFFDVRITDPTTGTGPSGMFGAATMVGSPTDTPPAPTPTHNAHAISLRSGNRLKRSYAHLGMSVCLFPKFRYSLLNYPSIDLNDTFAIPVFQPSSRRASETEILLKLNDYTQPGLYEEEFKALLGRMAKCACGMIMTQRVFKEHRCELSVMLRPLKRRRIEIIDLTLD